MKVKDKLVLNGVELFLRVCVCLCLSECALTTQSNRSLKHTHQYH